MDEILDFLCRTLTILLHLPDGAVSADSDLMADLAADSLDVVELLMAVEEKYGYYLPDAELIRLRTIGDLASSIHAAVSGAEVPSKPKTD